MTDKALDAVAEALSALIAERYPDGALMGAWTVSCEVLLPEAGEDKCARWHIDGQGSLITRRGLIEFSWDAITQMVMGPEE